MTRGSKDDRFIAIKAILLMVGAGFGIAGMLTEKSWLVWAGIGVLGAGIIVRLIGRRFQRED